MIPNTDLRIGRNLRGQQLQSFLALLVLLWESRVAFEDQDDIRKCLLASGSTFPQHHTVTDLLSAHATAPIPENR